MRAENLLNISGVGQVKSRQYGGAFLEVIRTYCEKHDLEEICKETGRDKSDSNRRYFIVGEAYNAGESVQSLMRRYQVTAGASHSRSGRFYKFILDMIYLNFPIDTTNSQPLFFC